MLTWNVYVENFNAGRIETHNIFNHGMVVEDCKKALKKCKENREAFLNEVRHILKYYYLSKCEWEITLYGWPPSDHVRGEKIDVWDQIDLNWHIFCDYIWQHRKEL